MVISWKWMQAFTLQLRYLLILPPTDITGIHIFNHKSGYWLNYPIYLKHLLTRIQVLTVHLTKSVYTKKCCPSLEVYFPMISSTFYLFKQRHILRREKVINKWFIKSASIKWTFLFMFKYILVFLTYWIFVFWVSKVNIYLVMYQIFYEIFLGHGFF